MISDIFKNVTKAITDTIFPPRCLKCGTFLTDVPPLEMESFIGRDQDSLSSEEFSCGELLSSGDYGPFSEEMKKPSTLFSRYFCSICFIAGGGITLSRGSKATTISLSPYRTMEVMAASTYEGMVKESIHLLKYSGKTALSSPLGLLLFVTFIKYCQSRPVDLIVPIPLYHWKMVKRGFNQSFLLIREFRDYWLQWRGSRPEWKIAPELLTRRRNTKSQTGFNRAQREKNIKGAFVVKKKDLVKGGHLILVDDVHTTGATLTEAGKMLFEAGASSVGAIVVAQA